MGGLLDLVRRLRAAAAEAVDAECDATSAETDDFREAAWLEYDARCATLVGLLTADTHVAEWDRIEALLTAPGGTA
ncbi:MAG: hypothetical protein KF887_06935 [Paracoccaceae bacterium]|nr:MAG: hypothetical protein KF887_06935 [Paracoccaceae bacterium]